MEDWAPIGKEREEDWRKIEAGFTVLDDLFQQSGEGDYVMGDSVCFANIILAADLAYLKAALGENSKEWQDISSWNGGRWRRFLESLVEYQPVTDCL